MLEMYTNTETGACITEDNKPWFPEMWAAEVRRIFIDIDNKALTDAELEIVETCKDGNDTVLEQVIAILANILLERMWEQVPDQLKTSTKKSEVIEEHFNRMAAYMRGVK
jgi:hypothetical protein